MQVLTEYIMFQKLVGRTQADGKLRTNKQEKKKESQEKPVTKETYSAVWTRRLGVQSTTMARVYFTSFSVLHRKATLCGNVGSCITHRLSRVKGCTT